MKTTYMIVALASLMLVVSACTTTPVTTADESPAQNSQPNDQENGKDMQTMKENPDTNTIPDQQDTDNNIASDSGSSQMISLNGNILAGSTSPYVEFNEADYQAALASGKTVVLYFYASWCPSCKAEQPETYAAFESLNEPQVIGFRVNYKDGESKAEQDLAREFGVSTQHTKVILRNGEQITKSISIWNRDKYINEIEMALSA